MFEEEDWERYWSMPLSGRKRAVEAMHPVTALHCATTSEDFKKELVHFDIQGCSISGMHGRGKDVSYWYLVFNKHTDDDVTFAFCHPDMSDLPEDYEKKEEQSWVEVEQGKWAPKWILMHGGDKIHTFVNTVETLRDMFPSLSLEKLYLNLQDLPDQLYPLISGMDCCLCSIRGINGDGDLFKIHEVIKSLKSIEHLEADDLPANFMFREVTLVFLSDYSLFQPEKIKNVVLCGGNPAITSFSSAQIDHVHCYHTRVQPQMIVDFIKFWKQGTMTNFTRLRIKYNKNKLDGQSIAEQLNASEWRISSHGRRPPQTRPKELIFYVEKEDGSGKHGFIRVQEGWKEYDFKFVEIKEEIKETF